MSDKRLIIDETIGDERELKLMRESVRSELDRAKWFWEKHIY